MLYTDLEPGCQKAAKTVTGLIGRATRQLYYEDNIDNVAALVSPHMSREQLEDVWSEFQASRPILLASFVELSSHALCGGRLSRSTS